MGLSQEQSELRCPLLPVTRELQGASVVDRSPDRMEWEESHEDSDPRHYDRIGCLPHRMGSNIERCEHGRSMEQSGEKVAYQLFRNTGTRLAVQTFVKNQSDVSVPLRLDNTTAVAYINHLGDTLSPQATSSVKDLWLWCLRQRILLKA